MAINQNTFLIGIRILICMRVLTAVLADTRNYFCDYASFRCALYMTKILKERERKNTGKRMGEIGLPWQKDFSIGFITAPGSRCFTIFCDNMDCSAFSDYYLVHRLSLGDYGGTEILLAEKANPSSGKNRFASISALMIKYHSPGNICHENRHDTPCHVPQNKK